MRTDFHRRTRGRVAATLALATFLWMQAAPAAAALCGDASGDGFLKAGDALATLGMAVTGGYDRRGDVMPRRASAAAQAGDEKITASDALEVLRAVVESRTPPCRGATATRAFCTTASSIFDSGGVAVVQIDTRSFTYRAGAVQRDAVARVPSGTPVVVNRHNYNYLQLVDVSAGQLPTINECSVSDGINSNPQDVVLLSESKGYVTPYAGGDLFVISPPVLFEPDLDPACRSFISDRIDLSGFDSDGIPEMDQMALVGSDLFVSLQRLDGAHEPTHGNGTVAVIDTETDTVKASIPLSFSNPFAETKGLPFDEFQQRLFVGGPGVIGNVLDDGGIEAIDPVAMESAGMVLTGADIQANVFDFVIVGEKRAFAIVADKTSNSVVDLDIGPDPADRGVREVLLSSTALITDIEMTELGELWVAYRGESGQDPAGIRIFDVLDDQEITAAPISLGQAPFTIAFFE